MEEEEKKQGVYLKDYENDRDQKDCEIPEMIIQEPNYDDYNVNE